MLFRISKELPSADGLAFVNPADVVFVQRNGTGSTVTLSSGVELNCTLSSADTAESLWRFTNGANDGAFFNDAHVQAVVPNGTGCTIYFSQGGSLNMALSADAMMQGLRSINAQRNTIVGQQ